MSGLLGQIAGGLLGGGGNNAGIAGALMSLIQNQPGGLAGLVQGFQNKGLGDIANSWVGTGSNLPINPQQIEHGLGTDMLSQIAQQLGVSPQMASSSLSQLLLNVVDKLTPHGKVPDHSNVVANAMSVIQSLLK